MKAILGRICVFTLLFAALDTIMLARIYDFALMYFACGSLLILLLLGSSYSVKIAATSALGVAIFQFLWWTFATKATQPLDYALASAFGIVPILPGLILSAILAMTRGPGWSLRIWENFLVNTGH